MVPVDGSGKVAGKILTRFQSVTSNVAYEPYGTTTQSGTGTGNSQQYAGRENDGTGLYYNRARYYNPALGRFISEDPIGFRGGTNIYSYVGGNPLSLTDPLGYGPWDKLYGFERAFWKWFHRLDNGDAMEELKDPATGQVPKEDAQPYYDEWKKNQDGFLDPDLLQILFPWWLTPSSLGAPACEYSGTCNSPQPPAPSPPTNC